ncbi:MAG: beta-N-acetylglucosaminidase domain-containing protein [Bacteroidaceae bacterium]|nr:beta-N-acetylglucosaminidase domain-containing protein [Bacteroidaceae bacterium]
MKKKILALALVLMAGAMQMQAQMSLVNPTPQRVEATAQGWMPLPTAWNVVTDKARTGSYAVAALAESGIEVSGEAPLRVVLGVKGDKCVKKYAKRIPAQAEGYYLHISEKGIVVAGADERGLYYGVQTLLASMAEGKLQPCTVTDWPDVAFRGVVEGFYGTPWSQEARLSQLDFYGKYKMNVYIYGPKDDPYHRDKWRVEYPEAEAKKLQVLLERAKMRGVNFYWAIHPGVDIKWTTEDRDALMAKLEKMYQLGVRSFAVFFDDIWGEGAKADKQAELLNYVDANFVQKKHDVAPLVLCPTIYNRAWSGNGDKYLLTLGENLNKGIEVMWTGNSVVHCIDRESMEWINDRIKRKGYIWWNYPVSDYVRDHILLGPTYGNGLDIAPLLSGFVSNPMEHAEASKISLYSIADYTWNMKHYDQKTSWERAIRAMYPDDPGMQNVLRTFAVYNEDLGPNGHGFRREESRHLKEAAAKAVEGNGEAIETIAGECLKLMMACNQLMTDKKNPALRRELYPWLAQGKLVAEYGTFVCAMAVMAKDMPVDKFSNIYNNARSLQEQMYDLENSNLRHPLQPGIKVGTGLLLPTLNKIFANAVNKYNTANSTEFDPVAEFQPFTLESNVEQLKLLPVKAQGGDVSVTPALEVITWPADGQFTIKSERPVTLAGMDFDFGAPRTAELFKLEVFDGTNWREVSLLHYNADETTIHTGNELGGMKAQAIRISNKSGKEQKLYFKRFKFVKQ